MTTAPRGPVGFGPRAVLVSAVIGCAIGVIGTLAFAPFAVNSQHKPDETTPTPTINRMTTQSVEAVLNRIASAKLGYSNATGKSRVVRVVAAPAFRYNYIPDTPQYFNVQIAFTLSTSVPGYNSATAEDDVFEILDAIYTSDLPVNNISCQGMFQFDGSKHPQVALRAGVTPTIADRIDWTDVSRGQEKTVWKKLSPHWISGKFSKYSVST
jgi:hypothetical protein